MTSLLVARWDIGGTDEQSKLQKSIVTPGQVITTDPQFMR
jgi:hypothetical protein